MVIAFVRAYYSKDYTTKWLCHFIGESAVDLPLKFRRSSVPAQGPWCKNEMAMFRSQAAFNISHSLPYCKNRIISRIIGRLASRWLFLCSGVWQHFLLSFWSHVMNRQEGLQICLQLDRHRPRLSISPTKKTVNRKFFYNISKTLEVSWGIFCLILHGIRAKTIARENKKARSMEPWSLYELWIIIHGYYGTIKVGALVWLSFFH